MAADGAATQHRGGGALPYRGGSGDKRLRASRRTTTPTDNRILAKHNYEFLTLGPGAISQGRGDEDLKGTEQLEIAPRGRSSRRALQSQIVSIFAAVTPRGRMQNVGGGFSLRIFPSRRGPRSYTSFYSHIHRRWGSIGSRGTTVELGRKGAANHDRKGVNRGNTSKGTCILRKRCARLQILG